MCLDFISQTTEMNGQVGIVVARLGTWSSNPILMPSVVLSKLLNPLFSCYFFKLWNASNIENNIANSPSRFDKP
jgi:hypothetical protein